MPEWKLHPLENDRKITPWKMIIPEWKMYNPENIRMEIACPE